MAYFTLAQVIRGEAYGRKADIWSLGCCVVEMATGAHPWHDQALSNHFALMFRIATGPAVPTIPKHLSPDAHNFITACLQKEAHLRPTIEDLLGHPFVE